MNLERITNQPNQLNKKFEVVSSLNALTPEEQWKKLAQLDRLGKEININRHTLAGNKKPLFPKNGKLEIRS